MSVSAAGIGLLPVVGDVGAKILKTGTKNVDDVIQETLTNSGNITSSFTLSSDEALDAGLEFLGDGYKETGKPGSRVFRSADQTRQLRVP